LGQQQTVCANTDDMPPPRPSQLKAATVAPTDPQLRARGGRPTYVAQPLGNSEQAEVLAFLAERPVHTVIMSSFIRDNGVESPRNRGTFYGWRNARGRLMGVALIGHSLLFEARDDASLRAFAALPCAQAHMIMGEHDKVARLWLHHDPDGKHLHQLSHEWLLAQRWPVEATGAVRGLRRATQADLDQVLTVHAEMAFAESGVNPLQVDPVGFRLRTSRRIERGRVWVWFEAGRLIFKTDVVAETAEVIYLEGVYVNPAERGRGHGLRCLSQLSRVLLQRAATVCLLVNEQNLKALALYQRAGFKPLCRYSTIYLPKH
jgi:predicted GNAT family acetyltransferase